MAKKHCVHRWALAHLAFSPSLINLYALEGVIRSFDIIVLIFSSLMSGEARGLSDRFHDCLDSILKASEMAFPTVWELRCLMIPLSGYSSNGSEC